MARTEPLGIDVSRYQHPINWDKMYLHSNPPVRFIAFRATIGNIYIDPFFLSSWDSAVDADVYKTAYHVVRPDVSAVSQMEWFLQAMGDRKSDLPLTLDCELSSGQSKQTIAQVIYDCANIIEEKTGKKPMIYSRTGWVIEWIGLKQWLNNYDWWMAYYGTPESQVIDIPLPRTVDRSRLIIHQTTDRLVGAEYGTTSKQVDGNRWVAQVGLDDYVKEFRGDTEPEPPINFNIKEEIKEHMQIIEDEIGTVSALVRQIK